MMREALSSRLSFALSVALLCALLGAIFNHGLDAVIGFHRAHPWCVWLLPIVLMLTLFLENRLAAYTSQTEEQSDQRPVNTETLHSRWFGFLLVPLTWMSHLGGASVGRESVAARLGRSIAFELKLFPWLPFSRIDDLLAARIGVACGFATVFGSPFAGAIFALESVRSVRSASEFSNTLNQDDEQTGWKFKNNLMHLLLCLVPAWIAHLSATQILAVQHPEFPIGTFQFNGVFILFHATLFIATGVTWLVYKNLSEFFQQIFASQLFSRLWVLFFAACALSVLLSLNTFAPYKNLGTDFIQGSLASHASPKTIQNWDWLLKSLFTTLCLGLGFRGGAVTPLLSIGVLMAVPIGALFGVAAPFAAASGYAVMFSAIMNMPFTGAVLALETFGFNGGLGAMTLCLVAGLIFSRLSAPLSK